MREQSKYTISRKKLPGLLTIKLKEAQEMDKKISQNVKIATP